MAAKLRGVNTLVLNQATMNSAVQLWVDQLMGAQRGRVKKVTQLANRCRTFEVEYVSPDNEDGVDEPIAGAATPESSWPGMP